jgi:hypothetical protein
MSTHAIRRTSPKGPGQKFVGTCIKCGEQGLTLADADKPCENIIGMKAADALVSMVRDGGNQS